MHLDVSIRGSLGHESFKFGCWEVIILCAVWKNEGNMGCPCFMGLYLLLGEACHFHSSCGSIGFNFVLYYGRTVFLHPCLFRVSTLHNAPFADFMVRLVPSVDCNFHFRRYPQDWEF